MASRLRRSKSSDDLKSICGPSRICGNPQNATVEFHGPPRSIFRTSGNSCVRTMHNKCVSHRVQLGEKIVRCLSFFASHPSMCPEENWHPHHIGRDYLLIDTYTERLMSECECVLLIDPEDRQEEPNIVAVEMKAISRTRNSREKDELSGLMEKVNLSDGKK